MSAVPAATDLSAVGARYTPTTGAPATPPADGPPIHVKRWPAEGPLLVISALVAASVWVVLTVTVIGLMYAAFFGVFFFVAHVGFVAHLRGNAVRVGPDQLPALHARVASLARRMGFAATPEVYVLQAGGTLNALATRFFRTQFVVLFTELLEACGDDEAARDTIIAHELGHLRAGHLRWQWLLLPSALVPFLGGALSRAREYTADRYGLAGAGSRDGAVRGLTLLAAGPVLARHVDKAAFVRQHRTLDTGWMRLGEWMMSHPPLPRRIAQLEPALGPAPQATGATARALGILAAVALVPAALGVAVLTAMPGVRNALKAAATQQTTAPAARTFDGARVTSDFARLTAVIDAERDAGRPLPRDPDALRAAWERAHPDEPFPLDPGDGSEYGYTLRGGTYQFLSSGPDGLPNTPDDLTYEGGDTRP